MVSFIAVIIIGAVLKAVGVMNVVAPRSSKSLEKSEVRIIAATIITSFMQNIGAAALFRLDIKLISRQFYILGIRILMQTGFRTLTGGCMSLVGASPLIMSNNLMNS